MLEREIFGLNNNRVYSGVKSRFQRDLQDDYCYKKIDSLATKYRKPLVFLV